MARDPVLTPDGGGLIYAGDQSGGVLNLWWRPLRGGREHRLTRGAGDYLAPRISRDGRRLVCEARTSVGSLRVLDLRAASPGLGQALTGAGAEDGAPSSARTGRIAFSLRPERNVRHLDERCRRRKPPTPHLGRRERLASCDLARREPRRLRVQPWGPPRPVAGVRGGGGSALAGARGRRGPAVLVAGWSEPRLRRRGEGLAGRAVGGVRRRRRRGRRPGREGPQPGLVSGLGPDRLLHVVGVGRAPDSVHEQPGRIPPGPARRGNHRGRRLGLLLERGSARDRRLSGIRGSGGRRRGPRKRTKAQRGPAAALHGAARDCLDPRRRAASSTASSSTRAGSCCSRASAAARASGS